MDMKSSNLNSTKPDPSKTVKDCFSFIKADPASQRYSVESSTPVQIAFSLQEWCLHLIHDANFRHEIFSEMQAGLIDMPAFVSHLACAFAQVPPTLIKEENRFSYKNWNLWPFNFYSQSFMFVKQWWMNVFGSVPGVNQHKTDVLRFTMLQFLECLSPANFLYTNPVLIDKTIATKGLNLFDGYANFLNDAYRLYLKLPPEGIKYFKVGRELAITEGVVVLRNELMELIQYKPTTLKAKLEPILIVPAWIMKYYILDLRPENSMVKYLVDHGYSVFIISWKNPTSEDRSLGLEDYVNLGVLQAMDRINQILNNQRIHGVGYCLGGTLLSMVAAKLARDQDKRLASITLLAAQTDFTQPGDIGVFIDKYQISLIESVMRPSGYLDSAKMSGAFQMIGSADRKWAQMTKEYVLGERPEMSDLMAWNADGTRLPICMHLQYLTHMYLNNDLAMGRYKLDSRPIDLSDIKAPIFALAAKQDFVAPWRSVFKLHQYVQGDIEFVLTSGGHNAGIINPPASKKHSSFQHLKRSSGNESLNAQVWLEKAPIESGSWWPYWLNWLNEHSDSQLDTPIYLGAANSQMNTLGPAPGTYVLH